MKLVSMVCGLLLIPALAVAQTVVPTSRPPVIPPAPAGAPLHIRAFVGGEVILPAATQTFKALAGSNPSSFNGYGAGADVYGLPFKTFVCISASATTLDATRVFVVNQSVVSTGLPMTISMRPVEIGGGLWFAPKPATPRPPVRQQERAPGRPFSSRVSSYVGASLVILRYREFSTFSEDDENATETHKGVAVFAGLDVNLWKFVGAGVEAAFRQVEGFGEDGVSEAFGEDQLGGFALKFVVSVSK